MAAERHVDIKYFKNYNLLDDKEIEHIISKRKQFYQISNNTENTKENCIQIIKLELNVMELCGKAIHERKNDIPQKFVCETIEFMILMSNRIEHLYYSMFEMFSIGCVLLLVEYLEFRWKYSTFITNEINPIIAIMLKQKCDPQMFIAAGTFAYQKKDIVNARQYFVEGINMHTNSKILYLEHLWIEVMYMDDVNGGELNEDIAIQTYRNTIEKFKHDMEFHFQLLKRSIEIKSISRLQYEIIRDLMEIYQQSDVMWNKVAELCSEGFVFDYDVNFFGYSINFLCRARCCILTYHKGLRNILSVIGKRNLMESLNDYIIKIWKMNKSINNTDIDILVKREMKSTFQMCHIDFGGLHKPEYYVFWAIISEDYRPDILILAIDRNRHNIQVWAEILEYHTTHNSSIETIKNIFNAGNSSLGNKALLLWEIMDSFLQQYSDITLLGKFYEEGAYNPIREISMVYKVKYFAWCHMNNGIDYSRRLFSSLISLEPDCKNLYMEMIRCEKQENQINVDAIKNLYSRTCSKFCQQENDVSLWTECMEFELTYFGPLRVEKIFKAAMRNVKPQLKLNLRRNYQSLIDAHSIRVANMQPVVIDLTNDD